MYTFPYKRILIVIWHLVLSEDFRFPLTLYPRHLPNVKDSNHALHESTMHNNKKVS